MKKRVILPLLAAAMGLCLAYGCKAQEEIQNVPTPKPASTASVETIYLHQDKEETERTVEVTGNGTFYAEPDYAAIRLGVTVTGGTAEEASTLCTEKLQQITDAAGGMHIGSKNIDTTDVEIEARLAENGEDVADYRAKAAVTVTVRNMANLGAIMTTLMDAGATETTVTFSLEDATAAYGEALTEAMADARSKADTLAEASEAKVKSVVSVVEQPYDESALTGIAFESSTIEVNATVRVTYLIG